MFGNHFKHITAGLLLVAAFSNTASADVQLSKMAPDYHWAKIALQA